MQSGFIWAASYRALLTQSPHLPTPSSFCAEGLAGEGALLTPPPIPGGSGLFKPQVLFGSFSNFHFLSPFDGSGWAEAARKTNTLWGSQHFLPQLQAFFLLPRSVSGSLPSLFGMGPRPFLVEVGESSFLGFWQLDLDRKRGGWRREVLVTNTGIGAYRVE